MNVGEPPGGSSAYLLAQDTLCGEFDRERVYGIAWQSKEFSVLALAHHARPLRVAILLAAPGRFSMTNG